MRLASPGSPLLSRSSILPSKALVAALRYILLRPHILLDMAFLHMEGYPIQKDVMLDHAQAILNYYAGDGWYRDGHSFDST